MSNIAAVFRPSEPEVFSCGSNRNGTLGYSSNYGQPSTDSAKARDSVLSSFFLLPDTCRSTSALIRILILILLPTAHNHVLCSVQQGEEGWDIEFFPRCIKGLLGKRIFQVEASTGMAGALTGAAQILLFIAILMIIYCYCYYLCIIYSFDYCYYSL
jgi:hypothetical protein